MDSEFINLQSVQTLHEVEGPVCVEEIPYLSLFAPRLPTVVVIPPHELVKQSDLADTGPKRVVLRPSANRHPSHHSELVGAFAASAMPLADFLGAF